MYSKTTAMSLSLLLGMIGFSQQATSQTVRKAAATAPVIRTNPGLTAAAVVKMLRAKISEPLIAGKITNNGKAIDLSVDQMVELKSAGASDDLLALMQNPRAPSGEAQPAPAPAAVVPAAYATPATPVAAARSRTCSGAGQEAGGGRWPAVAGQSAIAYKGMSGKSSGPGG